MLSAYEIIKKEEIADIGSEGILLKHIKSGARIALLLNDDNNKVFDIAFRTPPADSTGVAHIIEHTVLCGSKKYPLKDPFVELAKGSLNTFLNAMTYPDKTMYPVASCNDTDFKNLMGVYLDAVFYPNIYNTKKIFEQEGWHYHLEDKDSPLRYNGVVYNEMKGAYSSPDSVLENTVMSNLFPDTIYGLESGGSPDEIPNLTYEQYLDFHRTYYHPSNSYIFLYGNFDMEERLGWLDKEYLSHFDKKDVDSTIAFQKPFTSERVVQGAYPVLDNEPLEGNTYLNMSVVTGDYSDLLTNAAFKVLVYVLLEAPGAPLKKALLDAGIGQDVSGSFVDGILQPIFSVDVKYAKASDQPSFKQIINQTLTKLINEGLDEKAIRAAIHYHEFRFREADFSMYPKGLIYILSAFDCWLYDEMRPFDALRELEVYDELKKRIGTGYYEELIRSRIINNNHKLITVLEPQRKLAAQKEEALARKLEEYKASLSEDEIREIIDETAALEEYQNRKDSEDVIAALPVLSVGDIDRKTPIELCANEREAEGVKILHHKYDTRGISYLNLLFAVDDIEPELVPYMGALSGVIGYVDTERYSYSELSNEINAHTGGIECGLSAFEDGDGKALRFFGIRAKYLDGECGFALDMIREILFTSKLDDMKRLKEIITSKKAYLQDMIPASGHMSAVLRASSGLSDINSWQENVSGVTYYRFIEGLCGEFATLGDKMVENFRRLLGHIFTKERLIISITSEESGYERLVENLASVTGKLTDGEASAKAPEFVPFEVKDAVKTAGQVQYVASVGNFKDAGYKYTGAMRVLRTMLNYDYLWKNLREKGGAYGCMSDFKRTGDAYLVSYRDPHLLNTFKIYEELADYLKEYAADEKTMTKLIIGTISRMDIPLNAKAKGSIALAAYFAGVTEKEIQRERDEVLNASDEDIRALSDLIRDCFDGKHICVVGSEAAINKHEDLFENIEAFIQA